MQSAVVGGARTSTAGSLSLLYFPARGACLAVWAGAVTSRNQAYWEGYIDRRYGPASPRRTGCDAPARHPTEQQGSGEATTGVDGDEDVTRASPRSSALAGR